MRYYDTTKKMIIYENEVSRRGLTDEALSYVGIYPIEEHFPEFDGRYYYTEDGELKEEDGKYVMHHVANLFPPSYLRPTRKDEVTSLRWEYETSGITLNGVTISTGIDDQNRISAAIQGMEASGMKQVDFKSASGWVVLGLEEMKGIAAAIAQHVQACFTREKELHEAIDAAETSEEIMAIDINTGWSGNKANAQKPDEPSKDSTEEPAEEQTPEIPTEEPEVTTPAQETSPEATTEKESGAATETK